MSTQTLTTRQFLATYAVTLLVMLALDGLWLGWLANDFYRQELGPLMADSVRKLPAAMYYLGFPGAIVFLALNPKPASLGSAVLRCAVMGLAGFGVCDLTSLAIIRGYTVTMTVVDIAWGTFASTMGGSVAYALLLAKAGVVSAYSRT